MRIGYLFKYALSLPLHVALIKAWRLCQRVLRAYMCHLLENRVSTFEPLGSDIENSPRFFSSSLGAFGDLSTEKGGRIKNIHLFLSSKTIEHRFDLLGSGWMTVEYGMQACGFEGIVYSSNIRTIDDDKILDLLSPGNRERSHAIRKLIDRGYQPIDWQIDFKSGYRWSEGTPSGILPYGHAPGVDVKVPWELGRLQHLPWLVWGDVQENPGSNGLEPQKKYVREFCNQVLDFSAANPPRYGVNWLCTMDVAIRAANLLLSKDLLQSNGVKFEESFLGEFQALIEAHGDHIAKNLEWHDNYRANHYLADIAGLLFVAVYLPRSSRNDAWLAFCVRQLIAEVGRQFTPDGANFEGSTSYHRLSTEMVIYSSSLVLGLSKDKLKALESFDCRAWKHHPPLLPAPIEMHPVPGSDNFSPFPDWYWERLERMAEFSMHITKPNGRVVQIGDNDSGRFFKVTPLFRDGPGEGELKEEHLDHRGTIAAINGLFDRRDLSDFVGPETDLEMAIVSALSSGIKVASYLSKGGQMRASAQLDGKAGLENLLFTVIGEIIIEPPDQSVLEELETISYSDFGLYIWRSPRFFLSVRCGPIGQNGNGGHAHNDQLAIELNIDGEDWIADPGTYVYTASPEHRNAYRSVHAHAAPVYGDDEPSNLNLGLFRLENNAQATCINFTHGNFEGKHSGYGVILHRRVFIEKSKIRIVDGIENGSGGNSPKAKPVIIRDAKSSRKLQSSILPFSPGYGLQI